MKVSPAKRLLVLLVLSAMWRFRACDDPGFQHFRIKLVLRTQLSRHWPGNNEPEK